MSTFVRQHRKKLMEDYKRKKRLLQHDAYGYGLIREWDNMQPAMNQVKYIRLRSIRLVITVFLLPRYDRHVLCSKQQKRNYKSKKK